MESDKSHATNKAHSNTAPRKHPHLFMSEQVYGWPDTEQFWGFRCARIRESELGTDLAWRAVRSGRWVHEDMKAPGRGGGCPGLAVTQRSLPRLGHPGAGNRGLDEGCAGAVVPCLAGATGDIYGHVSEEVAGYESKRSLHREDFSSLLVEVRGVEPRSVEPSAPASPSAVVSELSATGTLTTSFPAPIRS